MTFYLRFPNVNNNGSMYKLKKVDEITHPCFTPFETIKYSDLITPNDTRYLS